MKYPTPRNRNARPRAFTLIELLVVVSVMLLLLAISLPALDRATYLQQQAVCLSQVRQINVATITYAGDFNGFMMHRTGTDWPHRMAVPPNYDLNVTFVEAYIPKRDDIMFCPTILNKVRGPQVAPNYAKMYVTYDFWNQPSGGFAGSRLNAWKVKEPIYRKYSVAQGHLPLWGCLTHKKATTTSGWVAGAWLGHDVAQTLDEPRGMSNGRVDGSAAWVPFVELEPIIKESVGNTYWWPITTY